METFDRRVQIGPEFFGKAFSDYSNRYWAFVREILQNSLDCGSTRIDIHVREADGTTVVEVANNGEPMTEEILTGKLLSLGSSGKDFQAGKVGGFGKAKEILYFAHKGYTIVTGDHIVRGSGASYSLDRHHRHVRGTTSIVTWGHECADSLTDNFARFIKLCGFAGRCQFTLNGAKVRPLLKVGDLQRTLKTGDGEEWGEIRLAKGHEGLLLVRIGGVPMYTAHCKYKQGVVVDLLGTSGSKLTSNRDSLKYPYSGDISDFIVQIAVDSSSAFKLEKAHYQRFGGPKLKAGALGGVTSTVPTTPLTPGVAAWTGPADSNHAGILVRVNGRTEDHPSILKHEFIVKNCVRRAVPDQFNPDSLRFSDNAHWLVRAWAGCLVTLYEIHERHNSEFSVGFILAEDTIAETETTSQYGLVYYLNPCLISRKRHTMRYKKANRHQILAAAAHEFLHGALDKGWHDEGFASELTFTMARVLRNYSKFAKHLK